MKQNRMLGKHRHIAWILSATMVLSLMTSGSVKAETGSLSTGAGEKERITTAAEMVEVGITWDRLEFTYDGHFHWPNATVEGNILEGINHFITVPCKQINAGTYTATAKLYVFNSSSDRQYKLKESDQTIEFTIHRKELTDNMVSISDETFTGNEFVPTISVKDGRKTLQEGEDYTISGDTSASVCGTYTVTIEGKGNYSGTITKEWKIIDANSPVGEITIAGKKWNDLQENISFDDYFKDAQTVMVTGKDGDGESGLAGIYYYQTSEVLTQNQLKKMTDDQWENLGNTEGTFQINPEQDTDLIVYVKLKDKSGNLSYLSTGGLVFDTTAPVISGVEDQAVYCESQTITIDDIHLKKITMNGKDVALNKDGRYTLAADGTTYTIVATDQADNSTSLTTTVQNGHTWDEGVVTKEATETEEGEKTFTCLNDPCHVKKETIAKKTSSVPQVTASPNVPKDNVVIEPFEQKTISVVLGENDQKKTVEIKNYIKKNADGTSSYEKLSVKSAYKKYLTLNSKTGRIIIKKNYNVKMPKKIPVQVTVGGKDYTLNIKISVKISSPEVKIKKTSITIEGAKGYKYAFYYNLKGADKIRVRLKKGGTSSINKELDKYISKPKNTKDSYILFSEKFLKKNNNKVTFRITAYYGKYHSDTKEITP